MGEIRRPRRVCFVYIDEAGESRFILVPYAEEVAAWRNALDGEWAELGRFEGLGDVPGEVVEWAGRGRR
jgi:hypothetical protein